MHYGPLTGQQAIEKLARAEPTRHKLSVGEFLRVSSADFVFLT